MKARTRKNFYVIVFLIFLMIIMVGYALYRVNVDKEKEKAVYEQGRLVGRAEGQESVKGKLPPPEPDRLLEGVVVGRDVESGKFCLLQQKGVIFRKGEFYYVKRDGRIVPFQKK